jgi:hypothetical protein
LRLKVQSEKERNCAFENLSLRCGATKINLQTCALQRNMPNSGIKEEVKLLKGKEKRKVIGAFLLKGEI